MLASAGPVDFFSLPVQASRPEGMEGRGLAVCVCHLVCLAALRGLASRTSLPHTCPHTEHHEGGPRGPQATCSSTLHCVGCWPVTFSSGSTKFLLSGTPFGGQIVKIVPQG